MRGIITLCMVKSMGPGQILPPATTHFPVPYSHKYCLVPNILSPHPQFQLPQPNLTKSIYCWTNCLLVPPIRLLDASVLNNNNSLNPHPQFQLPQPNSGQTMSCPRSGKLLFSYRQWYWNVLELQLSDFEMYWNVLEFQNLTVLEKWNCTGKCT